MTELEFLKNFLVIIAMNKPEFLQNFLSLFIFLKSSRWSVATAIFYFL